METAPDTQLPPAPVTPAPQGPESVEIILDVPIKRTGGDISKVTLTRPQPRELNGLNLRDLANMEAAPAMRLIPNISNPPLLFVEVAVMDISDLTRMAAEISNFLLPKAFRVASN